jgi:ornithine--oxo-acid transaminase
MDEKQRQYIERESQVCAPNYSSIPVVLEKGDGVWLYDIEGRKYLDMMSAYSAVSHGHCHPELVKVATDQMHKLTLCSRAYHAAPLAAFLEKISALTGMDLVLPMNSGAEAVETAIKASRRWGYEIKKIPEHKAEIIVANNNFHGRTTTIISFSSETEYKKDFGPLTPGFVSIPFGDEQALQKAITPHTCAFLVEPIQGEGGIIVPPPGWLRKVREICDRNNILLILDEVQSGLGRTGKLFAFQHDDIQPDGVILGKALAGALIPASAFAAKKEILELMTPGSHGSTFGGNPLAATIGLAALNIIERDRYPERAAELGLYLMKELLKIQSPLIQEIRGKGLWIGLEIDPQRANARSICEELVREGVLTKDTHQTVIRLAPPLIIEKQELDFALEKLCKVLMNPRSRDSMI